MSHQFAWLRRVWIGFVGLLDPLSKLATIMAVIIAGIWTYHLHEITGESDDNPEMGLTTQVFSYNSDERLLVVHIRTKNVGKVKIRLRKNALKITVKRVPGMLQAGRIDMDKQRALYVDNSSVETDLEPGVELEDVSEFVIAPGTYHIDATLDLPDGDFINDVTVESVL
jgi:hypothetical protein